MIRNGNLLLTGSSRPEIDPGKPTRPSAWRLSTRARWDTYPDPTVSDINRVSPNKQRAWAGAGSLV